MSGLESLRPEPARPDLPSGAAVTTDEGPALRDALSVAARIADDEALADAARIRYQADGLPTLEADAQFAQHRRSDEIVHATHAGALLDEGGGRDGAHLTGGTLYLTSSRLIHAGEALTDVPLDAIDEMAIALERLLLVRLRDGLDLALDVAHPRLLRVQIAAAMAASRGRVR